MSADNWTKCPKCGLDLREDYELGIVANHFEIKYRASCAGDTRAPWRERISCGFNFQYETQVKVI